MNPYGSYGQMPVNKSMPASSSSINPMVSMNPMHPMNQMNAMNTINARYPQAQGPVSKANQINKNIQ